MTGFIRKSMLAQMSGLLLSLALWMLCSSSATAQTTITTNFANNNASQYITFNFENTNAFDVIIQGVNGVTGTTGPVTAELWYKTTAVNGAPGAISIANGWTQSATASVAGVANLAGSGATAQSMLTGLTLIIPAGQTYGLCFGVTGQRYSTITAGTYTFPGGGCNLITGTNIGYGGTIASLPNTPRGFIGAITFVPAVPCTAPPAAGTVSSSANPVCPNTNFMLSINGVAFGTGQTYQWQSSPNNSTWSNIPLANNSILNTTQTTATYYRCLVTCGGQTTPTSSLFVTVNSFLGCYCTSAATSINDDDIGQVTFGSLDNISTGFVASNTTTWVNNPSAVNTYTDFSALPPQSFNQLVTYPISIYQFNEFGSYNCWTKVYIDYNRDGQFDPVAEMVFSSAISSSNIPPNLNPATGNIQIPITSIPGQTKMRVVLVETTVATGVTPCGTYTWGETEDYMINIVAAAPCTAPPVAGTASATPNPVCPGTAFTVSLSGNSFGTGQTYQWESSPDNINWTPIAAATNTSYTVTGGITVPTWYRCTVTCGGQSATAVVPVTLNSFMNCYCASNATSPADEEIFNVTLGSINNSSTCATLAPGPGSLLNQYSNYKTSVPAANLMQTSVNPFSVEIGTCGGNFGNGVKIFIDYNQDGLFTGVGEEVYVSPAATNGPHTETGNITIPLTAVPGNTVMRVVNVETGTPGTITPCGTYTWGETEDYLVNIVAALPCTAPPIAGTAVASPNPVCPSTTFSVSLSGNSVGTGQTFQWESSTDSVVWTPIAAATNSAYTVVGGVTVATWYRCITTCSGQSATAIVKVNLNSFLACYCASGATSTIDDDIGQVTVGAFTNTSPGFVAANPTTWTNNAQANGTYTNYTALGPINLSQLVTYPVSIYQFNSLGSYNCHVSVFIDYNQNGVFDPVTERAFNGPLSSANTGTNPNPAVGSLQVPVTSLTGLTRMRVVLVEFGTATQPPCGTFTWGETEDYTVNIVAAAPCIAPPVAGTATLSPALPCPSTNFTVSLTGNTFGLGQTYQWESSTDSVVWTPIAAATNTSYTVVGGVTVNTWYRCIVTCGGQTSTAIVKVTLSSFVNCYCATTNAGGAGSMMNEISFGTYINNTAATNPTVAPFYSAFPTGPFLVQGATYPFTVTIDPPAVYTGAIVSVWVDWNQNGLYEATEWTQPGTNIPGGTPTTVNITVPVAAPLGQTGMRVRSRGALNQNGAGDACLNMGSGETEDYVITVVAPVAWDAGLSNMVVPNNPCALSANSSVTISLNNLGTNAIPANAASVVLTLSGANTGTYTITNPSLIASYAATTLTFTGVNTSNPGLTNFSATVTLASDANATNNTATGSFTGQTAINTFPYSVDFETNNGGWIPGGTASSWAWGTPAGININSAGPGGTKAWVTNLTGNHNPSEESWLASPCFDFSAVPPGCDPVLSFSQAFVTETGWDGFWVEYSTNGSTWTTLGTTTSTGVGVLNWYNYVGNFNGSFPVANQNGWSNGVYTAWRTATHPLTPVIGLSGVRFRIRFHADTSVEFEGVGIDNIQILVPANDVGISAITPIAGGCDLSATQSVQVTITNYGCSPATNIPVTVTGGVPASISGTFTGTIPALGSATYTLPSTLNLSADGTYTLSATTNLPGDANAANNTSGISVQNYASLPSPTAASTTVCSGNAATLTATPALGGTTGATYWYDAAIGGTLLATGNTYTTPTLTSAPNSGTTYNYWIERNSSLKITEIQAFKAGLGVSSPYPTYVAAADDDLVEITNLGSNAVDIQGYTLELVGAGARVYNLPSGTPIMVGASQSVLIHVGTGTDNVANLYFHTAGTNNPLGSAAVTGFILRNGTTILDAVAMNNYTFLAASGVTAAHWSGTIPSSTGRAGVIRNVDDNNVAADWVVANTGSPVQTLGRMNTNLSTACPAARTQVTVIAYPCCPGGPAIAKVPDVAGSFFANGYCIDGNWIHYYYDDPVTSNDYLILSLNQGGNPLSLGTFGSTWGANGFNVKVEVEPNYVTGPAAHITNASTGNMTYPQSPDWYIMNRIWEVGINTANGGSQPTSDIGIRTYFTTQDFTQINAASPLTATIEDITYYKLHTGFNPLPSLGHAGVTINDIDVYYHTTMVNPNSLGLWHHTAQPYPANTATEHMSEYLVTSFSGGGGGSGNGGPLPVEDLRLSGYSANGQNYLQWVTATELNNAHFEVLRSKDGVTFEKVGQVSSLAKDGNSNSRLDYAFVDSKPFAGIAYYRLNQVDLDNQSAFSNTIELRLINDMFQVAEVYPNPTAKDLNIEISSPFEHDFIAEIFDVSGRMVFRKDITTKGGSEVFTYDVSELATGTYSLRVRSKTENFEVSRRFVKSKQ